MLGDVLLNGANLFGLLFRSRLGNSLFETCTRLELWHGGGCNFDGLACTWIFTGTRCALAGRECAETDQSYGIALGNGAYNRLQCCIKRATSGRFGNFATRCNCFDQFCFIQVVLQFIRSVNALKPAWLAKVAKIMADVFRNVGWFFASLRIFDLKPPITPIFP